ncbi:MAG: hypothetical protein ACOCXQ_04950 [Patescibacteria group bacterium]
MQHWNSGALQIGACYNEYITAYFRVLYAISKYGPISLPELQGVTLANEAQVRNAIKRLTKSGIVTRNIGLTELFSRVRRWRLADNQDLYHTSASFNVRFNPTGMWIGAYTTGEWKDEKTIVILSQIFSDYPDRKFRIAELAGLTLRSDRTLRDTLEDLVRCNHIVVIGTTSSSQLPHLYQLNKSTYV